MVGAGSRTLVVVMGIAACSPNSGGQGTTRASGQINETFDSTEDGTDTPATSPGDSADGVATGGATDGATMGATTMPPGESGDGPMSTTDGGPPGTTGDDGPPVPMQEVLEHTTFGGCNLPLWCYEGSIDNPAGGPMWMQECFNAGLTPPFQLMEVQAVIRGIAPQLNNVQLQVYQGNGALGPGGLIDSRPVDAGSLVIGENTFTVNPPIMITQPDICIGLSAPSPGLAGALGVSVNPGAQAGDLSYFRLERGPGCQFPMWTDIIGSPATTQGNWCIRATIEEQL